MKKIALDLDGVVFDSENLYRVYTEIYDVDIHKNDTIIDNTQRRYQERYNWKKEEFDKFYDANTEKILKEASVMTGAEVVLKKLKERFNLIIVTARNDFETNVAINKLNEIGLGDIKIYNNEEHKIDRLINENVDYMIDDDENICINASDKNICALYFKNNAANSVNKENVVNVNNWGEIYKYLMLKEIEAK